MKLAFDPTDLLRHVGEAFGLIVTAIAQEHDAPMQLLDAMQDAVRHCEANPTMFAPETLALVRYATKVLDGAIESATAMRSKPN